MDGGKRTSWVKGVDVYRQIHRLLRPNSIPNLLNNTLHTNRINLPSLHNFKPTIPIIIIIAQPTKGSSNSSMDIRIISQQPLLMRMIEISPVIYRRLLCRCTAKNFRLPGIEVGVEMYDADGAVGFVYGTQEGESDGVVAAEGDDAGEGFAFL